MKERNFKACVLVLNHGAHFQAMTVGLKGPTERNVDCKKFLHLGSLM